LSTIEHNLQQLKSVYSVAITKEPDD